MSARDLNSVLMSNATRFRPNRSHGPLRVATPRAFGSTAATSPGPLVFNQSALLLCDLVSTRQHTILRACWAGLPIGSVGARTRADPRFSVDGAPPSLPRVATSVNINPAHPHASSADRLPAREAAACRAVSCGPQTPKCIAQHRDHPAADAPRGIVGVVRVSENSWRKFMRGGLEAQVRRLVLPSLACNALARNTAA